MSTYTINHTCGHTINHNLLGPIKDRETRASYLETQPCLDCARAEKTQKAQEQNKDLPKLEGTEKQIAWAETIRAQKAKELETLQADIQEMKAKGREKAVQILEKRLPDLQALLQSNKASDFIKAKVG